MTGSPSLVPSVRPLDPRKRAAILAGARIVFLRDGFALGGMDEVALVAGVGKQTVYRHFGSKEALIAALVEAMCAGWSEAAADTKHGLADLERSLRAEGEALVSALTTSESIALYRAIVGEAERNPELGRLFWDSGPAIARRRISLLLESKLGSEPAKRRADAFVQVALGQAYLRLTLGLNVPARQKAFRHQLDLAIVIALS